MPSFKNRSYQKELLDGSDISFEDIKINMQELDVINRILGGHRITLRGVQLLLQKNKSDNIHIVEIGSGGGNNLRAIKMWADKNNIRVTLSGIEINADCISYAKSQPANSGIEFICNDYKKIIFDEKPDIIFSSLFCHHFTNEEIIFMLQWMKQNSTTGFFINDLHRHAVAYYSILFLTQIFSNSRLVKNDAPISVLRGFKKSDWKIICKSSQIQHINCQWMWAFRWLITSQ